MAYARLLDVLPRDDFGWPPKDAHHCPFPGLPAFDLKSLVNRNERCSVARAILTRIVGRRPFKPSIGG